MKINTKTIHSVDYGDLERAIFEAFDGITYELPCDAEVSSGTSLSLDNITKAEAESEAEEIIEDVGEWIEKRGKKQLWGPRLLMLDMVHRDLIPEGDYIIEVFW